VAAAGSRSRVYWNRFWFCAWMQPVRRWLPKKRIRPAIASHAAIAEASVARMTRPQGEKAAQKGKHSRITTTGKTGNQPTASDQRNINCRRRSSQRNGIPY